MAGKVNYDDRQFAVYAKGRAMSPAMRDMWMTVFARHAPPQRPLPVVDLGCDLSTTGRRRPRSAGTGSTEDQPSTGDCTGDSQGSSTASTMSAAPTA